MSTFGTAFNEEDDGKRIRTQMQVIRDYMLANSKKYLTLKAIEIETGYPQSSISAQLRHLKKQRFGGYELRKERMSINNKGTYVYNLKQPAKEQLTLQGVFVC